MAHILVVEDEIIINELIVRNLVLSGHQCSTAYDGCEALEAIKTGHYDLILLDVMLPYLSGFDLVQHIEATPVIFVTAKGQLEERLKGLTSGAQDYIVKPFEMLELAARINIVLGRHQKAENVFVYKRLRIDFEWHQVFLDEQMIELTPQEYNLLEIMVINRNIALSREKILELAWGYEYIGDTRTVDVHIQRLRKKLDLEEAIKTIYKMGYRLEVEA